MAICRSLDSLKLSWCSEPIPQVRLMQSAGFVQEQEDA